MAKPINQQVLRSYKNAVGILLATYRKDDDGVDRLIADCDSKAQLIVCLASVSELLMREMERIGGEPVEILQRWALNVYRNEVR